MQKELNIFTYKDLLEHFPLRHIDKTQVTRIKNAEDSQDYVQIAGKIISTDIIGQGRGKRFVAWIKDDTAEMELVWFQGINWIEKKVQIGGRYLVFGKINWFNNQPSIAHPEIEALTSEKPEGKNYLEPIYPSTEKLKARWLGGREIGKLTRQLFNYITEKQLPEVLPKSIVDQHHFISRFKAYKQIHFPANGEEYAAAVKRLKFEEVFLAQLRLALIRSKRHTFSKGFVFEKVSDLFNTFYNNNLPFRLTDAQKRVLKEIRKDIGSGKQMNRLLQGDVGSGKTIVALMTMLIAADNGYQNCMMAPTEILATQHYNSVTELLKGMPVNVKLLTGSTPAKEKKVIYNECTEGTINILIGTHAVIQDKVVFKNLGLAIIDEQHKFGVEQRSKLWNKNDLHPHILVMTATPIPRTLALTAYGDLDYSVIDELPPGRQPVSTAHRYETRRADVMNFVKEEIRKGRQAYIIYPLIEESAKMDFENLMKGYEEVKARLPEPQYWISMVHGKQKPELKETNMQRFVTGDTQIMVSTTVIEVGVNVPNASVMVIESAEKFGLTTLHQLRGRVGRGSDKSFCILLTGSRLSNEARERLKIMCETNDGFVIAEKDLALRGPGDIEGTRQSGMLDFKLADLVKDKGLMELTRTLAEKIVIEDAQLNSADNLPLKSYLMEQKRKTPWSKIS